MMQRPNQPNQPNNQMKPGLNPNSNMQRPNQPGINKPGQPLRQLNNSGAASPANRISTNSPVNSKSKSK